jgi:hypothetical protein
VALGKQFKLYVDEIHDDHVLMGMGSGQYICAASGTQKIIHHNDRWLTDFTDSSAGLTVLERHVKCKDQKLTSNVQSFLLQQTVVTIRVGMKGLWNVKGLVMSLYL